MSSITRTELEYYLNISEELKLRLQKKQDEVKEYKAYGDLKENEAYQQANGEVHRIVAELGDVNNLIETSEIRDAKPLNGYAETVAIGSEFFMSINNGVEKREYLVVVTDAPETIFANIESKGDICLLSSKSSLCEYLIGKTIGDYVKMDGKHKIAIHLAGVPV